MVVRVIRSEEALSELLHSSPAVLILFGGVRCGVCQVIKPQNAPFKLRSYQQEAVDATLKHFRKSDESAVIVLPTGAGKSLVIASWPALPGVKFWC